MALPANPGGKLRHTVDFSLAMRGQVAPHGEFQLETGGFSRMYAISGTFVTQVRHPWRVAYDRRRDFRSIQAISCGALRIAVSVIAPSWSGGQCSAPLRTPHVRRCDLRSIQAISCGALRIAVSVLAPSWSGGQCSAPLRTTHKRRCDLRSIQAVGCGELRIAVSVLTSS